MYGKDKLEKSAVFRPEALHYSACNEGVKLDDKMNAVFVHRNSVKIDGSVVFLEICDL